MYWFNSILTIIINKHNTSVYWEGVEERFWNRDKLCPTSIYDFNKYTVIKYTEYAVIII